MNTKEVSKGPVEDDLKVTLCHQKEVYNARCKRSSRLYKVSDLVWQEEKAVPMWMCWKFYYPLSGNWRAIEQMKVLSDIAYRINCEEVALTRESRMVIHFNCLKPNRVRPLQLQPMWDDVQESTGPLSEDQAPTKNAEPTDCYLDQHSESSEEASITVTL